MPTRTKLVKIYGARFERQSPEQVKRRFNKYWKRGMIAVSYDPKSGWQVWIAMTNHFWSAY